MVGFYEHGNRPSGFIKGLAEELIASQEDLFSFCLVMLQHGNSLGKLHIVVIL